LLPRNLSNWDFAEDLATCDFRRFGAV